MKSLVAVCVCVYTHFEIWVSGHSLKGPDDVERASSFIDHFRLCTIPETDVHWRSINYQTDTTRAWVKSPYGSARANKFERKECWKFLNNKSSVIDIELSSLSLLYLFLWFTWMQCDYIRNVWESPRYFRIIILIYSKESLFIYNF